MPIAYYLTEKFLTEYIYRTQLQVWIFAVPTISLLILSVVIISVQSIKAALANPIDAMRTE
jgi:hypothetical protein